MYVHNYFYFYTLRVFHSALSEGFLLKSEWQQVSRTLLSIQADLNNAVVWMVFTSPFIYKSSKLCINPLVTTKSTNHNWYHRHLHVPQFFNSLPKSWYLSIFSFSFNFTLWSTGTAKSTILQALFFFVVVVDYYKVLPSGRD